MFIFKDKDNKYKVALENTHAIVVFYNIKTKQKIKELDNIQDFLHCRYSYTLYPESYKIDENTRLLGGRKWKSLKFAVANELGWEKPKLFNYLEKLRKQKIYI